MLATISLVASEAWTQYYFRFELQDKAQLKTITDIVSIDNVRGNWVYAYANDWEFAEFQKLNLRTQILPNPGDVFSPVMSSSVSQLRNWDSYPTYDAYIAMMYQFASTYPNLCQIVDAGTTVNGRKILFAKISDNIATHEAEPEVMYTATMHGDETTGYILTLRLIDTLLSQYGTDTRITNMVNNLEIWINPLANPDGTYYGGNSSVSGARRANANGYDINRNFPSPTGAQYSGQPRQVETTIMMNLALSHRFALSANFHGGAEVVNYPWDFITALHPDNNWWITTSLAYAQSAQANGPAGYFTGISSNGITNGAAWYMVNGGRQDWMNYTARGREACIEISNTKLLPAAQLNNHWNYNYNSLLSYLEQAYYGIHGFVKDPYGNPLDATIRVIGLDNDYSYIKNDPEHGDFYRYLSPGTYSLEISASGFPTKIVSGVQVIANQQTELNVVLGEIPHSQIIPLEAGWNLISFNVQLPHNAPETLFASLGNNLIQVKEIDTAYSPLVGSWFDTLGSINIRKGYWVKVQNPASLSITAPLVQTGTLPINLNSGWNLVSYLPDTASPIATALSSIYPYLEEVRSNEGTWMANSRNNTLSNMQSGMGYWIKVNQACTLSYP